ncbi:MAG: nucleotide-disulfide oxidoreductase [Rhodomicrobium sp.]|nr:MAG: nucleotide-disulfide oxidoreductase [Rhodomicrobium sp.]
MAKQKIVIIGGGFAGVFAANELRKSMKDEVDIELINKDNYFVFQPLLPEVAGGALNSSDAITSLRLLLGKVQVRLAEVVDIDFEKKSISVLQGTRRMPVELTYDHLVLAMGQSADLSRFPGMTEHALTIKYMGDAFTLRNQIIRCLEHADVAQVPEIKKRLLTFIVVGAGFSGVETVGEIKHLIDKSLHYFPNISKDEIDVRLIEFADRILLELPGSLGEYAKKQLEKNGVKVITGVGVNSATGTSAELSTGEIVPTSTVLATIGTGPNALVKKLDLDLQWGKIKVDRCMRVAGKENVWALGDAALIPMKDEPSERQDFAPPTAQFAVREGKQLALNIRRVIHGWELKDFAYVSKGALASLGASKAVAEVNGIKLKGVFAWLLWRSFYLSFLPGFVTKVRVFINWMMDSFVSRNLALIEAPTRPATRYLHYRKGDIVFDRGMIADGFYTVIKGKFELVYEDDSTGERVKRSYGPGEHFGERIILGRAQRTGRVKAKEDGVCLWVARDDFKRFADGFPMLDKYFDDYIREKFGEEAVSTDDKLEQDNINSKS